MIGLEIGFGVGALLQHAAKRAKEVHGLDISGEMLKAAAERLEDAPKVHLRKTDGDLSVLPDRSFDLVYCSGVFIHFPEKAHVYKYMEEAARVLKPGGMYRFHVDGRSYLKWRAKGGTLRGVTFSERELREYLSACGFVVWEMTGQETNELWTTAVLPA